MNSVVFEIVIILLLIIANGIFAMSEIAIVSANKIRLQQRADDGDAKARVALALAESPNRFLATVQIGITLIGIFAGAFGGATLSEKLAEVLRTIPVLTPYSQGLALGIVVACITYLSLVIGELVPKQLALNAPEKIATTVAKPMRTLSRFTAPLVSLLSFSTDNLMRLLGVRASEEPPITEAEIQVLISQGTQAGTFHEAEQEIVERVFELDDLKVGALMTQRRQVIWLDVEDSEAENLARINNSIYSRFPVCQGDLDTVLGIVKVKELFTRSTTGGAADLRSALNPPLFIPENTHALKVLEMFKKSGQHMTFVVDEYGAIQGLVTLNDIMEAIVGDLPSEDVENPQAVQRSDGSWLLDGMLSIDEFQELFDLDDLPQEDHQYHSLGGFMITRLGHIPVAAEHFEWRHLRFEVVDMDGNRVDKVLVQSIDRMPS
jgi:putative hemolysin